MYVAFSVQSLYVADLSVDILLPSIPSVSDSLFASNPAFIKTFRGCQGTSPSQRLCITSSPASAHPISARQSCSGEGIGYTNHKICANDSTNSLERPSFAVQSNDIDQWIKDNLPSRDRPKERLSSIISLSSASSCEIQTNTDVSEDEHEDGFHTPRPALPRSTLKTIDVIMRRIEVNLAFVAHTQCNGGKTSNASTSTASTPPQGSRKTSQGVGKRRSRDHPPPHDEEDDGANKRRRGSLATVESSETGLRFACPFFKHEPNRYRNRRTCPGPGWLTVHRMKEHLYRAHAQSIYCPRCYTMFDADIDLSNHLRSAQCHVSAPQPVEGIDRETLQALRKRSPALRLEEDKWRDVYRLLFPDVAAEDIPSPCKWMVLVVVHNGQELTLQLRSLR
jgi:hypothetical protein